MSKPRILYVQYTNPACYPSLEHSSRILARAGWEVLFLGTEGLGVETLRFPPNDRVAVRRLSFCPAGWRQKLHYLWFCIWVLGWAVGWRPRWVYCSDPLSCPVALALTVLPGVRLIYHEHDSPNAGPTSNLPRFILWSRRRVARRAALCILPNQQRAEWFAREIGDGEKVLSVWNCPAQDEILSPRPPRNTEDLWVLYHGSIVPSRLPLTVLRALAMLPATMKLRVIGYETVGYSGYVGQLEETALQLGIGERVEFLGSVPDRNELYAWCRRCDIGLAFMPKRSRDMNERAMIGASNKPFDYLACGLALLVSDLPDWRRLYVDAGYGLACDPEEPESIAAALRWFLEHPDEMRKMGERGRRRIEAEWNYERQFEPVVELMSGTTR